MGFHENMGKEDLFFRRGFNKEENSIEDVYSEFVLAATKGEGIILDEYNKLKTEARLQLLSALDTAFNNGEIRLPTGEVIPVAPGFFVIGTLNEGPGYQVEPIDPAESDRFEWIYVDYMPPREEYERLAHFISPELFKKGGSFADHPEYLKEIYGVLKSLTEVAQLLRANYHEKQGQVVPRPLSTRVLERIAKHLNHYPEDVYRMGRLFNRQFNNDFANEHVQNYIRSILATKTNLVDRSDEVEEPVFKKEDLHYEGTGNERVLVLRNARVHVGEGAPATVKEVLDRIKTKNNFELSEKDIYRLWWILKDLAQGNHMAFLGYKGTAKTVTSRLIGELLDGPNFVMIPFDEETEPYHYIARRSYKKGKLVFEPLALPKAMEGRRYTMLEEFNAARPKSRAAMNEVFARNELNMPEFPSIRAPRGEGFVMVASMNPAVKGYRRHQTSNELWDRVTVETFSYPEPEDELAKMRQVLPDRKYAAVLDQLVSFANVLRNGLQSGIIGDAPSMRFTMEWVWRLKDDLALRDAIPNLIDKFFHLVRPGEILFRDRALREVGLHQHFLDRSEEMEILRRAAPELPEKLLGLLIDFGGQLREYYKKIPVQVAYFPLHPGHLLLRALVMEVASRMEKEELALKNDEDVVKLFKQVMTFFKEQYIRSGLRSIWDSERLDGGLRLPAEKEVVTAAFNGIFRTEFEDGFVPEPLAAAKPRPSPRPATPSPAAKPPLGTPRVLPMVPAAAPVSRPTPAPAPRPAAPAPAKPVIPPPPSFILPAVPAMPAPGGSSSTVLDTSKVMALRPDVKEFSSGVTALVPHPSDPDLVFAGFQDGRIEMINVATKTMVASDMGRLAELISGSVRSLAVSDDGKLVAASVGNSFAIFEISGKLLKPIDHEGVSGAWITAMAFHPDNRRLGIASGAVPIGGKPGAGTVYVRDVMSKSWLTPFSGKHSDMVTALAWSPDGKYLVTGSGKEDKSLQLWDARRNLPVGSPAGEHIDQINSIAWNEDNRIVVGSKDFTASAYTFDPGTEGLTSVRGEKFQAHTAVSTVAFGLGGKIVAVIGQKNRVKLVGLGARIFSEEHTLNGDGDNFTPNIRK